MGFLSLATAGALAAASLAPAGRAPRAADESALVERAPAHRHRCPHAEQPLALLLVKVKSPALDLAHYLDADRPGGFAARVMPYDDAGTPHVAIAGDPQAWRWVGVNMDRMEAFALAYRLRELPAIADARVLHVVE